MLAAFCALLFDFPHGMLEDVQAVGGSMLLDATTASATEPAAFASLMLVLRLLLLLTFCI